VSTKFGKSSISNLGYASVQCSSVPIMFGKMSLACPYGQMKHIVRNGLGVNKKSLAIRDACLVDDAKFGNAGCSSELDSTQVYSWFN